MAGLIIAFTCSWYFVVFDRLGLQRTSREPVFKDQLVHGRCGQQHVIFKATLSVGGAKCGLLHVVFTLPNMSRSEMFTLARETHL